VKSEHSSPQVEAGGFRTTRWSVVLLSAQSQAPGSKAALEELCSAYWYPLYAFVRYRGHSPQDAQDLTQGFFLHLFEHKALTHVDPLKGKFRSFMIASLQNYLSQQRELARRLKRGGKVEFVCLDLQRAEDRYRLEPINHLTPEMIFNARWGMALLGAAMNRLERECAAQGKTATFETLKTFLDPINSETLPSYEQIATQLKVSISAVKTLIHRLRKQHSAFVRQEISRTVSDSADVDAEVHELCEAIIAAEGWVVP
jgi:RNA polymerase sigma factor (sigma-70 family)